MPNLTAEQFITKVFTDKDTDLSVYNDPKFCSALQLHCLNDIYMMLYIINKSRSIPIIVHENFKSNKLLNSKNEDTGLSLMDYCIIAGLSDFATKLNKIGCKPSQMVPQFQERIKTFFKESPPEVVINIRAIFTMFAAEVQNEIEIKNLTKNQRGKVQKFKNFVHSDYIYPAMLAVLGFVLGIISVAFFSGMVTKVFLTLGISCLSTSGILYQAIKTNKKADQLMLESHKAFDEITIIWQLLDLTKKMSKTLKKDMNLRVTIDNSHRHPEKDYVREDEMLYLHELFDRKDVVSAVTQKSRAKNII